MGRIRSVHPDQWTDADFDSCPHLARLLALAVRNVADDNGMFPWKSQELRWQLLPADDCDVAELLSELESSGQIVRFEADGRAFGMVRNFTRYQSPCMPTFKYPPPAGETLARFRVHEEYRNALARVAGVGGGPRPRLS